MSDVADIVTPTGMAESRAGGGAHTVKAAQGS